MSLPKMLQTLFIIILSIETTVSQVAFVAVGSDITPSSGRNIAYSTDGTSWNIVSQSIFSVAGNGVAYSTIQNKWIAVGEGALNTMAWSPNGITWIGLGKIQFPGYGSGITYSPEQNRWVALGRQPNSIHYSTDGFNWTAVTPNIFSGAGTMAVYSNTLDQWVAVGWGDNMIAVSPNGITWTGLGNIVFTSRGFSVSFANGIYVATGGNTITQAWSANGVTWTTTPEFISNVRHQAVYAQNRWLMVGPPPVNIQNSTDGKSWSNKINPVGVTDLYAIVYNPAYNRYVAMGTGTNNIIYSSDGNNWNVANLATNLLGTDAWKVATTGFLNLEILNPTPIISDVVDLITNTSIINQNTTITVSGNLTVLGDLAVEGGWILTKDSIISITGILNIKGNTTFDSLNSINCQTLSISSAIGDSQLILMTNLTIGSSITYPLITYTDRSGSFNKIVVRSVNPGCPVATQSYSSSTLSVSISMNQCNPNIEEVVIRNDNMPMIIGISVSCVVFAGIAVLILILVMRKRLEKSDSLQNAKLRDAAINDLQQQRLKASPGVNL